MLRVHNLPRDENASVLHHKGKSDVNHDDNSGAKSRTFSSAKKQRRALGNLSNSQVNARQQDMRPSGSKEGMKFQIRRDVGPASSDGRNETTQEQFVSEDMLCTGISSSKRDPADVVDRMSKRIKYTHRPGLSNSFKQARRPDSLSQTRASLSDDLMGNISSGDISFGLADCDDSLLSETLAGTERSANSVSGKDQQGTAWMEAFSSDTDLLALLNDD